MRRVYLLRHGEPAFPGGQRLCISRTNLSLSPLGRMQAVLLRAHFENVPLTGVFHSPLSRARETAFFLSSDAQTAEGLEELGVGQWEGLPFEVIRERWPREYALRGEDPAAHAMPGGESPVTCLARAEEALRRLMERTQGDIALVCHAGVNRLLLCAWTGRPPKEFLSIPQPCGCVNSLRYDGGWRVDGYGERPTPPLSGPLCERLWDAAGTPEPVRHHCRAVADKALVLGRPLVERGYPLDLDALYASALLHDVSRVHEEHASVAAKWLDALGYPRISRWIAGHHNLPAEMEQVCEGAILYLADKLISGEREVTLEERFARSLEKCHTPQAREAHRRRAEQAGRLESILKGEQRQ